MAQVEISNAGQAQPLTRRTFLQGTLASSTALMASCASTANKPITLNWICEEGYQGDIKSFQMLAHMYNAFNKEQVTIDVRERTKHDRLQQMFTDPIPANRAQYDILSLDVVWTSEFANNGWVIPLDHYWPDYNKTNLYLPIPLKAASYHNKLYAAPLHSDVGVLYYRTDFSGIIKPENIKSWDDLASMAQEAQQQKGVHSGFTWQALPFEPSGTVFEGLMCNFVEILSGYGGKIFDDPHNPSRVLINSQEARIALNKMKTWIKTISPNVDKYEEKNSTDEWISSQAAFMRNWPSAVVDSSNHSASLIADTFAITTLPFGRGCLGGWQLAINRYSTPEKQDKAWKFIWWMLQRDAQRYLAIKENFPVTLAEIYDDEQIKKRNIYYNRIKYYINNSLSRPAMPNYQDVTKAIATMINDIFTDKTTPDEALPALEAQLQKFIPYYHPGP